MCFTLSVIFQFPSAQTYFYYSLLYRTLQIVYKLKVSGKPGLSGDGFF